MCFGDVLTGINERLDLSSQAANPIVRSERAHVQAGRDGENAIRVFLEPLGNVHSAVRISDGAGRKEIDLILQTRTHVYLFEIKNWSGNIELTEDGKWRQIRQKHYTPREIVHENALDKTLEKEILFRNKVGLQKNQVSSYVVFPNKNAIIAYGIGRDPRVMSSIEFEQWAKSMVPNGVEIFSRLVLPSSWTGGFDAETEKNINFEFSKCSTWDEVKLEGGKILTGDFKSGPKDINHIDRSIVDRVEIQHNRNHLIGTVKAVFGYEARATAYFYKRPENVFASAFPLSFKSTELKIDSVINFREAGQQMVSKLKINNIVSIKFSKNSRNSR